MLSKKHKIFLQNRGPVLSETNNFFDFAMVPLCFLIPFHFPNHISFPPLSKQKSLGFLLSSITFRTIDIYPLLPFVLLYPTSFVPNSFIHQRSLSFNISRSHSSKSLHSKFQMPSFIIAVYSFVPAAVQPSAPHPRFACSFHLFPTFTL